MLPVSCLETEQDVVSQIANVSCELLAAQARLTELRRQRQVIRLVSDSTESECLHGRFPSPSRPPQKPTLQAIQANLDKLPLHLGWGSSTLTAVLRPHHHPLSPTSNPPSVSSAQPAVILEKRPSPTAVFKLYPDLALAMLRTNRTAVGRIWYILREVDTRGAGWVSEEQCRALLTERDSTWRVCGWRQLRNLLRRGEGIFWQRRNGRIWLASVAKTAAALQVERLAQRPTAVPVSTLTAKLSVVRAHFYASFHSSHQNADTDRPKPIARATLNDLTTLTPKTQRAYEQTARVKTQANFAIGKSSSPERLQETAWKKGAASFELVDRNGRQGKAGATYVAWQLPNSYRGPHQIMARGRQKQINRELTDLFMKGMTGNGQKATDQHTCLVQRYFRNGRLAAQAFNQGKIGEELYWCSPQPAKATSYRRVWHVITQTG